VKFDMILPAICPGLERQRLVEIPDSLHRLQGTISVRAYIMSGHFKLFSSVTDLPAGLAELRRLAGPEKCVFSLILTL